ncbi:MAG: DUF2796 domain-containing protein [Deltaproteobacteria bacterium]|jgi:hypothetical protein|nr:DUF2796 domain-containing protein [Deltaproteobacteria bacterium]
MKTVLAFFAAALCLAASSPVLAHGPHEHGAAVLNLAVDGSVLSISLESPLANFLGFEHAPETEQQKAEALALAAQLRKAEDLFRPDPAAGCRLEKVSLESEALQDILGEPSVAGGAEHSADNAEDHDEEHGDLDAEYSFLCLKPEALHSVELLLFSVWPGFRDIDVQMVTPAGQGAAELTPEQPVIRW